MEAKKRKSGDHGEGAISNAALTSVMSKRWRVLFTLIPSLDLDDSIFLPRDKPKECQRTSFMEFVNRVLALQSNSPITKFSLKCDKGVDESLVEDWIRKALRRGATDLSLVLFFPSSGYTLPSSMLFYRTQC
ncbi:putative F-box/LRR-repeat protein [Cardamine amara subsp. amara]|uniref:F-box/LRR-repeat protein n=1 Tax=Cardamine amara subsp. amara TaxID=228776 RepID=A0ABD0Z755_CARAN